MGLSKTAKSSFAILKLNYRLENLEKIYEEIKSAWLNAADLGEYIKSSYRLIYKFCIGLYVFEESELKIYKRYKISEQNAESQTINDKDFKYIFILLCSLKSHEIFELLNFIVLPTDIPSFTETSILREIQITKSLKGITN
ncbi:hypothetical protein IV494_08120 [Kaistella sp. G5-32]|uniref:Uncharacterized protein n=1 Tax=Kaistella gelatinilytica TaxID=2787636 RepID=A0ABS0FBU4_9FLAO|nr:hypothetical protein [Kaistella gelatinilytica]MBF8457148.1 hypothetical protein [Kaistella gelatinilytica]